MNALSYSRSRSRRLRYSGVSIGYAIGAILGGAFAPTIAEILVQISDLFIVGMGDSFASGEGNPDVPVRFSTDRAADYAIPTDANAPRTPPV